MGRRAYPSCSSVWRGNRIPIQRVIVVDNGSTDDSAQVSARAGATVISLGANTGFSHAVNCGIRAADSDWIAILNNDVWPEPDWLGDLWRQPRPQTPGSRPASCWTPRARTAWTAHSMRSAAAPAPGDAGTAGPTAALWNQPRQIHFAPFTAAIFRAELFQRVGLLDESLESYLEDVDFGIRCSTSRIRRALCAEPPSPIIKAAPLSGTWHPGHGPKNFP